MYAAAVLLSLNAYTTYSNADSNVVKPIQSIEQLSRLFGSVIIVTGLGSVSAATICFIDRFLIREL